MIQNKFRDAFRLEHYLIYDDLHALKTALRNSDIARSKILVKHLKEITELHFKVESEILYPRLAEHTSEKHLSKLTDASNKATRVLEILSSSLSGTDCSTGNYIYMLEDLDDIMVNIINCHGLTLILDMFSDYEIDIMNREIMKIWESPLLLMNMD